MDLSGSAAQHSEILAGEVEDAAIDGGAPGDHAIGGNVLAGHAE